MKTARTILSVILALSFTAPSAGEAQTPTPSASAPVIRARGSFFALSVSDMAASVSWYRDKLGLSVIMQAARTDATKSAATVLSGGGLTVELVQHDDAVPLQKFLPTQRGALYVHGIFKVGIIVNDFDATLATLRSRGIEIAIGPFPKRPDQPANAIIRDNAGNYIQIFGP
ncbi:MAG TPA: VOC family protein [Gemmatimonadaceae bacterium]|nr:VOC family protein [Gemmatimonadaceae bacterium]